jgi:hypothetical protein
MKKLLTVVAASAIAAIAMSSLSVPIAAAADETTDVLSVDFAQTTGTFRGGATGTLYGFGDEGAPTQALINGAAITNTSQKAPHGTQHPSGDAIKVEDGFFQKHGKDMYIYVQDYYPDWSYNGGVRPGDTRTYDQATGTYTNAANGIWDYLEVVEFVAEAVAAKSSHPKDYVFIPFNEPDGGNWYANWTTMKPTFLADWLAAFTKIQEVYARHGLGHARIGGPGDTRWQPTRSADILTFAKANAVLPDIFIWHELGIDNLRTFRSHVADYRQLESSLGVGPIPINITEYGMLRDMGTPGQLVQWLSIMEDLKIDGQTAYWNYAGNFNDNSARTNSANAGWWMYRWYGDLAGSQTVKVTPPTLNAVDTLQGIATIDTANKRATVVYGGGNNDVSLDLTGLDPAVFGSKVDIEVREDTISGAEGVAGAPPVIKVLDGVDLAGGSISLTVPTYDRYAGYQVIITPEQDRALQANKVWTASTEAENTTLTSATAYVQDPLSGGGWKFLASGGRDVGSFNSTTSKADWTVTVPRDGNYRFQVIGATPSTPGRHVLFVDGSKATLVQYTADLALTTYQKWQYRGSAEVTIPLTAGQHTLSLRSSENGTSVLPNSDITLDKFLLTDVTDGEPTVYPASTLRYAGGAKITYDKAKARGYGDISGSGERADVYTQAWETGYYDLTVDYRTTGTSDVDVRVNGRAVTQLSAPREGGWRSTARVHLAQGINEIELSSPNGILLQQVTTTRVPEADGAAVTIEAENTIRHGATSVNTFATTSGTNASGLKGLGFIGNGEGNTFEVVRGPGFDKAGDYDIAVTYANAELGGAHAYNPQVIDRRLDVKETSGAASAGHAYFRYTYAWNSFLERTIPVTLSTAGGSLVFGNASAYAPDIDKINIAPVTVGTPSTVSTDTIAPAVSGSVNPAPVNGWVGAGAKLTITATDNESVDSVEYKIGDGQFQTYTEPVSLPDGSYIITVRATDASANSATDVVPVKVDGTPPSLTWQSSIDPQAHYLFGSVPAVPICTAADQTSGSDTCTISGYSTAVGTHELKATARDVAGNTTVETLSYSVDPWTVKGFYQPVDMNGVVNTVKSGATVPLKFEVFAGATELTSASSVALSTSTVACDPQAPQDEIELTSTGPTSLRYEDGQFVYDWKTPKSAGTCYRVTATTVDGSSIAALFRLR